MDTLADIAAHGLDAASMLVVACFCAAGALMGYSRNRLGPTKRSMLGMAALLCLLIGAALLLVRQGQVDGHSPPILALAALAVGISLALWPLAWRARREPQRAFQQMHQLICQLEHEVLERKRAEQELQKSQELLRQLAAYQERVKEDERKRIAREIHDELGQNLMALRIDIAMLEARTGDVHPRLNLKTRQVLKHVDNSIKSVRSIINNLRPSVLDLGLQAALEWQVAQFEKRTGISCDLLESPHFPLDDEQATALFRVVQESLTNVARHAQATLVTISLRAESGKVVIKIADNGVGLYPGCRRKPNSFGLLGIGERVSSLGGEFKVDSVPGEGTVLTVAVPLRTPERVEDVRLPEWHRHEAAADRKKAPLA